MSFPDLTPASTVSAITLLETSTDVVATVVDSLAIGYYNTESFVSGARAQVATFLAAAAACLAFNLNLFFLIPIVIS